MPAKVSVALGVAVATVSALVLVASGVPLGSALLLTLIVALQVLAGAIVWKALAPRSDAVMTIGMGTALGTAMCVVSGVVVQVLHLGTWGWLIPPIVAVAVWALDRRRRVKAREAAQPVDRPEWIALAVASVLGLGTLAYNLLNYPLSWTGSWSGYHPDMPFFQALSTSLARLGPFDSAFLSGGEIRYHWLSYAWAGQVTDAAHAEPFVVLTRVLPLVTLVAGSFIVTAWARRASRVPWVPTLAVTLFLVGGYLGATYGGVLSMDSPSQSMSVMWLLALTTVLLAYLDGGPRWSVALLALLGLATMGGKVSSGAPALAGVALVLVVAVVRRERWWRRALLAAAVVWAGAGAAFVLLISGSAGGGGLTIGSIVDRSSSQQGLNPLEGAHGVMAGTVILMLAIAARWAGLLWLVVDRRERWSPATIFGWGLGLSSLAAVALFNSFNEIWFSASVSGPLAVLTAVGVGLAADYLSEEDSRKRTRLMLIAAGAAAAIYAIVWMLWSTGASGGNVWVSTWRWAGPVVGIALSCVVGILLAWRAPRRLSLLGALAGTIIVLVLATAPGRLLGAGTGQIGVQTNGIRAEWFGVQGGPLVRGRDVSVVTDWDSQLMDAAAWLRANAGRDDLLATNLTFGPFVPGVTDMRTYVSALQYQGPYGRARDIETLLEREGQVWDFVDAPSAATAAPLCAAGVRWIWVDPTLTAARDWADFASTAYANDKAVILRFNAAACP